MLSEFENDTRVVNLRESDYDIYIGRGSEFGNPFTHIKDKKTLAQFIVNSRDEAIESYRKWIKAQPDLLDKVETLRGKRLGCFCKPKSCHGDVLIEILNMC